MKPFLAEVKIFIFRPKTMDYSPWFDVLESKKSLEIRIPSERASTAMTTFTVCVQLNARQVSVSITPHWKVLRS